jgi:hypothetical protein
VLVEAVEVTIFPRPTPPCLLQQLLPCVITLTHSVFERQSSSTMHDTHTTAYGLAAATAVAAVAAAVAVAAVAAVHMPQ